MEKAPTSQVQEGSFLQMVKLVKNKWQESKNKLKVSLYDFLSEGISMSCKGWSHSSPMN